MDTVTTHLHRGRIPIHHQHVYGSDGKGATTNTTTCMRGSTFHAARMKASGNAPSKREFLPHDIHTSNGVSRVDPSAPSSSRRRNGSNVHGRRKNATRSATSMDPRRVSDDDGTSRTFDAFWFTEGSMDFAMTRALDGLVMDKHGQTIRNGIGPSKVARSGTLLLLDALPRR